jgi:ribosomal protein L32
MKCFFCSEEIADDTPVCPWCGRRQQVAPEEKIVSSASGTETRQKEGNRMLSEDTGWKCKNCGHFNVKTTSCQNCGKDKTFVAEQSLPADANIQKKSKADEYYQKGMKGFLDAYFESDKQKSSGHLIKAQGYLTMAYKAAGNSVEEKKGIGGLMAIILTNMEDCKNAETWAKAEISINPTNVFARLATYAIEVDKWVGHKGFVTRDDGSGFGLFASILTTGIDVGRVQAKKNAVTTAAIEAAKAVENKTRTEKEPNPLMWLLWSWELLSIIEHMWKNNMKEPYLCNVLLNLPWSRFTDEEKKDFEEPIEELQVTAHGFLGRLK